MEIKIRGVLGIESADIRVSRVACVGGRNGAGKTSLLLTAACAVTGATMPASILKKDAAKMVRRGAEGGKVAVQTDTGVSAVVYPSANRKIEGNAPWASHIAAGLETFLELSKEDRAALLVKTLKANPTPADLAAAMRDSEVAFPSLGVATKDEAEGMKGFGLDPTSQRETAIYRIAAKIAKAINDEGWDYAHGISKETGTKLKGAWERETGAKRYGPEIAANWKHADADAAAELVDGGKDPVSNLTEKVTYHKRVAAEVARNAAIHSAAAVDTAAQEQRVAELEAAFIAAGQKTQEAEAAFTIIDGKRPAEPPIPAMTCPHCSAHVAVEDGKLVPVSHAPEPAELAAAAAAMNDWMSKRADAVNELNAAKATATQAHAVLQEARKTVTSKPSTEGVPARTAEDVEAANRMLARVENALAVYQKTDEAKRLHTQIVVNQFVIDLLAPSGLRQKKLAMVLDSFNECQLVPLCAAAGWDAVTIDGEMNVYYGGEEAKEPLISESQVARVIVTLQIALAQLDKSSLVLIDHADRLDKSGRNGLFKLLRAIDLPAVVAMMVNVPELLPDLAKAGMGESYFLEGGTVRTRAEAMAPVAQAAE